MLLNFKLLLLNLLQLHYLLLLNLRCLYQGRLHLLDACQLVRQGDGHAIRADLKWRFVCSEKVVLVRFRWLPPQTLTLFLS